MTQRRRRLLSLLSPFIAVIAVQAAVAILSFDLLSAVRAYVAGEGHWSKSQKDAIYALKLYAQTGAASDFARHQASMSVLVADRSARLALERTPADLAAAREGFLGGLNHPDDISGLIWAFRYFRDYGHISDAIEHWRATDALLDRLSVLAQRVHADIASDRPDTAILLAHRREIEAVDRELAPRATAFSQSLGQASRTVADALKILNVFTAGLLLILAAVHTRIMRKRTEEFQDALGKEKEQALEHSIQLQAIVDNFPGGITFLDAGLRLVVVSDGAKQLLQLPEHLFADGPPKLEDLFRFNAQRGEYGPGDIDAIVADRMRLAREHRPHLFERIRPDGTALEVRGVPLPRGGFITIYSNITERRKSEARVLQLAYHDELTQLANRSLFYERLWQALRLSGSGELVAVHLIDLDNFKLVNDSLGHPAGDSLIKEAAQRLRVLLADNGTVARMGGDEFAVIQTGLRSEADAAALAERMIETLSKAFEIERRPMFVGASIGIALAGKHGDSPEDLMRHADLALYAGKAEGRSTFRFYRPDLSTKVEARTVMQAELRDAIASEAFEIHYQPVVDITTQDITGVEALVRWRHPTKGLVSPNVFIEVAEETTLIEPLGEWILRKACSDATTWQPHIRLAVNLSPVQFRNGNVLQAVQRALAESGLAPERLELEITESVLLDGRESNVQTLTQLRALGVTIALDDFGTGYSSLSYLTRFPLDKIKIDRSFVAGMTSNHQCTAIVCTIGNLGRILGVTTTAEGVETAEQLHLLRGAGFTHAQGYLFGRPCPYRAGSRRGTGGADRMISMPGEATWKHFVDSHHSASAQERACSPNASA